MCVLRMIMIGLAVSFSALQSDAREKPPVSGPNQAVEKITSPEKYVPLGKRQYTGASADLNAREWPQELRVNFPPYQDFLAGRNCEPPTGNEGFGGAFMARDTHVVVPGDAALLERPLTLRLRVKGSSTEKYNIFAAFEPKSSPSHWELYSTRQTGALSFYMPGNKPDNLVAPGTVLDGKWHEVGVVIAGDVIRLYTDGRQVAEMPVNRPVAPISDYGKLGIGSLVEGTITCNAWLDDFSIRQIDEPLTSPLEAPQQADDRTILLCNFEQDPALPAGQFVSEGKIRATINVQLSVDAFADLMLPRNGVEPTVGPDEKPPKGIPVVECRPEQLAEAVRRLGLTSVKIDAIRSSLLSFWGEQMVDLGKQIDGSWKLPRGADTFVYDRQALILPDERTTYAVVVRRIGALLEALARRPDAPSALGQWNTEFACLKANADPQPADVFAACAFRRTVMLGDPALDSYDKLVFVGRATYAGSRLTGMSNTDRTGGHFATQCFGFNTIHGGGLFELRDWRMPKPAVRNMTQGLIVQNGEMKGRTLDTGSFYSPEVSYDGRTVYFAHCYSTEHRWMWSSESTWKIFKLELGSGRISQLTEGAWNDFDPVELPSGRVVFISERRGGFIRCFGRNSCRVPAFVMHSMKNDGRDIYPISYYETSEWHPSVDNNGMLVYNRWDYTDRENCLGSQFWICYPDGRDPRAPHGNYPQPWHTFEDNTHGDHRFGKCADAPSALPLAEMHIRAIPGSHKYTLTAAPHHGESFGAIAVLDIREKDDGNMSQLRRVTPYIPFPESESPGRSQYQYGTVWPVSEDLFICNRWEDLVVLDRFGNEELVCERELLPMGYDPRLRLTHPKPLRARPKPPIIPQQTAQGEDYAKADKRAIIGVVNVNISDQPFPMDRKPTRLRVIQAILNPNPWMDTPLIGYATENTPRIPLGTVDLESDGSVCFEAPAGRQLIFQVLDENNMAIQTMRSTAFVHPGERLTCLGCHESRNESYTVNKQQPLAFQKPPARLQPECGPVEPVNFARQIAPIMNSRCVTCHQKEGKGPQRMDYQSLRPYVFFFSGGMMRTTVKKDYGGSRSIPGRCGAANSRIGKALMTDAHRKSVPEEERHKIILWLDANALQFSAYHDIEKQLRGELVWPLIDVDPAHPLVNIE